MIAQNCFTNQTLTFFLKTFVQMKKMKNNYWTFFKVYTYIYLKTYKVPNHLKENAFDFLNFITTYKIFLHEKIWFDKLQC
jgi:hypothetical protein